MRSKPPSSKRPSRKSYALRRWHIACAEEKPALRLNVMRDIVHHLAPDLLPNVQDGAKMQAPDRQVSDRDVVRGFSHELLDSGFLAP